MKAKLTYTDIFKRRTTLHVGAEWLVGTDSFRWTDYRETQDEKKSRD